MQNAGLPTVRSQADKNAFLQLGGILKKSLGKQNTYIETMP